jgi:hypothetical protein
MIARKGCEIGTSMKDHESRNSATESAPRLLYHYTTQAGLLGILESKSIWATHGLYLNDASELKFGIEMFKQRLATLSVRAGVTGFNALNNRTAADIQKIEELLRKMASSIISEMSKAEVFVASFFDSACFLSGTGEKDPGDTLEQWRAYSGGSGSLSIGFDKAAFGEHVKGLSRVPGYLAMCGSCIYESGTQEALICEAVRAIGEGFIKQINIAEMGANAGISMLSEDHVTQTRTQLPSQTQGPMQARWESIADAHFAQRIEPSANMISFIAMRTFTKSAFLKNPAFRTENEWRIVRFSYGPPAEIRFRPGQSSLIPYVPIPLPLGPSQSLIRRVVVGPSPRINEAVTAVRLLLKSCGYRVKGSGRGGRSRGRRVHKPLPQLVNYQATFTAHSTAQQRCY